MIWAFIARGLLALGIPARLHRIVTWAALGLIAAGLIWAWFARHDAKVIERHEEAREAAASGARERSAEERADDALRNVMAEQAREAEIARAAASEAAKPPVERATLPPAAVALNCQRMRQVYSSGELAKIPGYQELCR